MRKNLQPKFNLIIATLYNHMWEYWTSGQLPQIRFNVCVKSISIDVAGINRAIIIDWNGDGEITVHIRLRTYRMEINNLIEKFQLWVDTVIDESER